MNGDTHELWFGGKMQAFIVERPQYCTRGRYHALIEYKPPEIDDDEFKKENWPRYYFDLGNAQAEIAAYYYFHKMLTAAEALSIQWRFRPAMPGTIDMDALVTQGKLKFSPIKGWFDGECNRTACSNRNARYFNSSTLRYYCAACAEEINVAAKQPLCVLHTEEAK